MNRREKQSSLDEALTLLVQEYGRDRVQTSLDKIGVTSGKRGRRRSRETPARRTRDSYSVARLLEQVRRQDSQKYELLLNFHLDLKERRVLPDTQDIRYFAQLVGMKEITGKSRKDLIPKLMRFMAEQGTNRLRGDVGRATGISEAERRKGFSVLTDKLLQDK
jgi:hypothetical protein